MTGPSPAEIIARLDGAATRHGTPCGDGTMVWRSWGDGSTGDEGSGAPALVLLHGGFGSWLHWVRNVEPLAARRRVIAADLPGLGDSAMPPVPDDPGAIGAVVAAGLERLLGPDEPCHLVGFSFGGLVAGQVAARLGERVRTLTLVGASGLGVRREPMTLLRRTPQMSPAEREAAQRHNLRVLMLHREASLDDLALEVQARCDERARLRSRRLSLADSLRRVLPEVPARLNGIWGEHDATAVPRLEERRALLRALHPELRFEVIPGAGHWVQYEAAERFDALLEEMIRRGGHSVDRPG